jgi:hypothetical protein
MSGEFLYDIGQLVRVSWGIENPRWFEGRVLEREFCAPAAGSAVYRIESPDPLQRETWFEESCLEAVQ